MTVFRDTDRPNMAQSACYEHPQLKPNAWDPIDSNGYDAKLTKENKAALSVCKNECPVWQQCLAFALKTNQDYGIWGGTTANERRRFRRTGRNFAPVR
jgi:WhiB family redox-sensing transcriptional regulator